MNGPVGLNQFNQTHAGNNEESVGIGDFLGNGVVPLSALHINTNFFNTYPNLLSYPLGEVFRTDCPQDFPSYWRMHRGGRQYGMIYSPVLNSFLQPDNDFHIEATQQDFIIHAVGWAGTLNTNVPALAQRIRVTSDMGFDINQHLLPNATKTVIEHGGGDPLMKWPRAMLNLGTEGIIGNSSLGGWRKWMDVGVYGIYGTDNMYVGIKSEPPGIVWGDKEDAVISWGDNDNTTLCCGPDHLRFIFATTLGLNTAQESQIDGLEVARFTPAGFMGIGNFTLGTHGGGSGVDPARRLEIYDQHWVSHGSAAPQFNFT
jgi:hypothetical protein